MMRAARFHGIGRISCERVPRPRAPGPGEVRLRVLAAGICGSDIHNFRHGKWIAQLPVTPGHELVGEVIAVGSGVAGLASGDHVVADSRVICGECAACRAGRGNLCRKLGFVGEVCDGGFAEETVLAERGLVKVERGLQPEIAVLAEPLAVAMHAAGRLAPPRGASVLVMGAGPIGALTALTLLDEGAGEVLIADRRADRLELVSKATGARPVALGDATIDRIDFAADATGSTAALSSLIGLVQPGARIALVGIFHGVMALDSSFIVEREIDLVGCSAFAGELEDAARALPRLATRLEPLIGARIRLEDIPDAYAAHVAGRAEGIKTIMVP